jgi:hypothetical protein
MPDENENIFAKALGFGSLVPVNQPTPLIDVGSILDTLAKNPHDRVYRDQQIYLDGYTFTNCCFSHCELHSDSGIFVLRACLIMTDCTFILGSAALRIVRMFNTMYGNPNVTHPVYYAKQDSNGSITVE